MYYRFELFIYSNNASKKIDAHLDQTLFLIQNPNTFAKKKKKNEVFIYAAVVFVKMRTGAFLPSKKKISSNFPHLGIIFV